MLINILFKAVVSPSVLLLHVDLIPEHVLATSVIHMTTFQCTLWWHPLCWCTVNVQKTEMFKNLFQPNYFVVFIRSLGSSVF